MNIPCRKCFEFSEATDNLTKMIEDYIDSLDEEQKIEKTSYETRLLKCESCDALLNGLCKYCGCFVLARAAKKNQFCPYPKNQKW